MKTIVLIQCAKRKLDHKAKAARLYTSPLFKMNLQYAKTFHPDSIYILSAKHWLVHLNDSIEPYDLTLNDMSSKERRSWANVVIEQLAKYTNLHKDHFILLAGITYRQYLLPCLGSFEIPLKHKPIGKQLRYLSRKLSR